MNNSVFEKLKEGFLSIDPVYFVENNLTLDGKPFRLNKNGYKPFCDIYRYIGITALGKNSKPVVLVKGRQVGATTMAAALELFYVASGNFGICGKPPMRVLHAFPFMDHAAYYSKAKLSPMITGAVIDEKEKLKSKPKSKIELKIDKSSSTNDSLSFKSFENGNNIQIDSTGLTGDRLRGKTLDSIFFDEVQDMSRSAIVNSTQVLAKAQYGIPGKGIQVLFGTPKQKGTIYWDIWQNSTQQYYHLGCESCGKTFPLYTPGSNQWEEIWIEDDLPPNHPEHGFIVKCIHCGHEQDKRPAAERGKWISTRPNDESQYVGFHINQLYMPDFRRQDVISKKPENNVEYTERAYMNEVLGEFYAGDAAPLTPEEVREFCGDLDRGFARSIGPDERKTYLGADWGDKVDLSQYGSGSGNNDKKRRGQSYSSVVVISVEGSGIINIEFARLLKRNDLEFKKSLIQELYRRYSIVRGVGDIGHAGDLSEILYQDFGEQFIPSRAAGSVKNNIKYDNDIYPPEIKFDKNHFIADTINLMKRGKIRFPYKSYEQIGWLVSHCTSMEIKPSIDRAGNIKINYVKGSTQNDGFMSLINALLAMRFDMTDGFNIHNPNNQRKPGEVYKPPIIGAYIPGLNPAKRL